METVRINIVNFTKGNSLFNHVSQQLQSLSRLLGNETFYLVKQNES